jgi:hypothetical protein
VNDNELTIREVRDSIRSWAREAYDDQPDHRDPEDLAHEQIDGCEYVIYYHKARTLWANYSEVQEYEQEANEYVSDEADIDQRIAACVYLWLREMWLDAWRDYKSNSEHTEPDLTEEDDE